uniref:VWFA domain-containing protein n=1 Tax=Mycena chlorophos TaxID=658473 RepID=A0ABQ0MB56_MYCCL|nr:predicted protein [Mycena chlorophos]
MDSDSDASVGDARKFKVKKGDKRRKDKGKGKAADAAYTWEAAYTRSWDTVQEDEAGSLQAAVEDWMARGRRRRLLAPEAPVRRTIIRHLVILLDLSTSMLDRDMRPTRFDLSLQYAREFIVEWFDQNPLGQIGIVGMRGGIGERVGELSGNPQDVLKAIADRHRLEPAGEPSLQNAIELAKSSMNHLPTHSSREIVIIFGSLTTCDPHNIHDTLDACVAGKIRISVVALAAEMKICRELCDKTGGQFGVALNEGHFKDLLFELIPPPAQRALVRTGTANPAADLMMMGFPTRLPDASPPSLCVCHSELRSEGFLCPRCLSKVCDVPTDCDICDLMIVSSPHLARSYHHLFPVKPYTAVMAMADASAATGCEGCARRFPTTALAATSEGMSPVGRYRCSDCSGEFCSDCDVFVHDVVTRSLPLLRRASMAPGKKSQTVSTKAGPKQQTLFNFFKKPTATDPSSSPSPVTPTITNASPSSDASTADSASTRRSRPSSSQQPPFKRKAKVDSDSEAEDPNDVETVAHVSRRSPTACPVAPSPTKSDKENVVDSAGRAPSATTPPRKKARTASPCPAPIPIVAVDDEVPVPSSQGNEDELMPTVPEIEVRGTTPEPGPSKSLPRTPQQNRALSPQHTPATLTPNAKTAKVIADIKAKAKAKAMEALSSDEDDNKAGLPELPAELSEDDDDALGEVVLPSIPPQQQASAASRYTFRDRNAQRTASSSRKALTPPAPKKDDPFAALLKEKRNAVRRGVDDQALLRAEQIIRSGSPLTDMTDDEDGDDVDWTDENAARNAVIAQAASSDDFDEGRLDAMAVNDNDRLRLLGDKRGKEVAQILGNDRARREAAKGKQKVIGVPLWQAGDSSMETDVVIPVWAAEAHDSPALALLRTSFQNKDDSRASILLNSGILARLNLVVDSPAIICLFHHALSSSPCSTAASNALSHLWANESSTAATVPSDVVLSALYRIGAKDDSLATVGWTVRASDHRESVSTIQRNEILYRLVRLVFLSSKSSQPPSPHVVMALILVAMDPTIESALRTEITTAIGRLCNSLGSMDEIPALEATLGQQILRFAVTLQPHNQSHLLALITCSERGRRLARFVAHALLTSALQPQYNAFPPLGAIRELFSSGSSSVFASQNYEEKDYDGLLVHIGILATALTDIAGYVKQEAQQRQTAPPGSPSKINADKPETEAALVVLAMNSFHGSINDTRAAHLDRSRAKSALQRLKTRVHFEQEAAVKSLRAKRSRPIQQYFAKNK